MKRFVHSNESIEAAEEPKNEALELLLNNLKDDFDFLISGLEKLERSSAEDSRMALEIAESFSEDMQKTIAKISDRF